MDNVTDFEFSFDLPTGPLHLVVTADPSRELDFRVGGIEVADDWVHVLLFVEPAEIAMPAVQEPSLVVEKLVGSAEKFFRSVPSTEALDEFRAGVLQWITAHNLIASEPSRLV
jgi:hypothetical protein